MSKIVEFSLSYLQKLEDFIALEYPQFPHFRILYKSLDARKSNRGIEPKIHYQIELSKTPFPSLSGLSDRPQTAKISSSHQVNIIGAGPAGLFCALTLVKQGIPCRLFERGKPANERMKDIAKFWRYGILHPDSNVCFGEGGAGLYSDGKLITRIKSPLIKTVMKDLVVFGAPTEVEFLSNPHLGSNKIRTIISNLSQYLAKNGCEFYYQSKVSELIFEKQKVTGVKLVTGEMFHADYNVLASGHSADELYFHLHDNHVQMESKDFSVGVRVEHPRSYINKIQYGDFTQHDPHHELGAARYRLSYHDHDTDRGTYSFCMCPGGYVLSTGSAAEGLVTNGMSNYARNSHWSNSAIVVTVKNGDDFKSQDNVLAGLHFQRSIENMAYKKSVELANGRALPAMNLEKFMSGSLSKSPDLAKSSCPSGLFSFPINQFFSDTINDHLKEAFQFFDRQMKGFISNQAQIVAPETRTSAPVRVLRDKILLHSLSHGGLYPCGEGSGYAGGITSAAVDGIKVAEAIGQQLGILKSQ
jgi:uncharacterized FAD-dependent dehydrogenase